MRCLFMLCLLLQGCAFAWAQNEATFRGYGYVFGAPGFTDYRSGQKPLAVSVGGGGEAGLVRGLTAGAELAYMHGNAGRYSSQYSMGMASLNASYHWGIRNRNRNVTPFSTWGYTHGFNEAGNGSFFNLGAGAHYWFRPRLGVRFEFRDTAREAATVFFRIGLAFR